MSRKQVAHCLGQRSYLVESKLSISLLGQIDLVVADLQAKLKLGLYKESEGVHRFNVRTVLCKTYPSVLRHYCVALAVISMLRHTNASPNACMIPPTQGALTKGRSIIMKREFFISFKSEREESVYGSSRS